MSARNNNQNPSNYKYNAFLKIQTRDYDKYYHFYLHNRGTNNFSIEVKPSIERHNLDQPRPIDYQPNARFYAKEDLRFEEKFRIMTRYILNIINNHVINHRDFEEVFYVEELERFLNTAEMVEYNPDYFDHA